MKKIILTLASLCLIGNIWAYDFKVDGIYYNRTSTTNPYTVEVTYYSNMYLTCSYYSGSINIPSTVVHGDTTYSVTSIGKEAFYGEYQMSSITIPSSIISIGYGAFIMCGSLHSIDIPSSVTSIGDYAFDHAGLNSVDIPSSVVSIGKGAFAQCEELNSIKLPSSIDTIAPYTFSECFSLDSISIPFSITSIGAHAFEYCDNLSSIKVFQTTPIKLYNDSVFYYVDTTKCVLYVPSNSVSAYKIANVWKGFTHIMSDTTTAIFNTKISNIKINVREGQIVITGTSYGENVSVYSTQGLIVYDGKTTGDEMIFSLPIHGVYVVKIGKESFKIIY